MSCHHALMSVPNRLMPKHVLAEIVSALCHEMFKNILTARRGKGGGFSDNSSQPFFVAVHTIKVQKPKCFVLECVDSMSVRSTNSAGTIAGQTSAAGESNDLAFVESLLKDELPDYTFVILTNRSPVRMGYPMLRPRFYALGMNEDRVGKERMMEAMVAASEAVTVDPVPDFLTFLNLRPTTLAWML